MKLLLIALSFVFTTGAAWAQTAGMEAWTCRFDSPATRALVRKKNQEGKKTVLPPGEEERFEFEGYSEYDDLGDIRINVAGQNSEAQAKNDQGAWESLSVVAAEEDTMDSEVKLTDRELTLSYSGGYHFGSNEVILKLNRITGKATFSATYWDSCNPVSGTSLAIYRCKKD